MTDHYDSPEPAWRRTQSRVLNLIAVALLVGLMANMCWTFTVRRGIVPTPQGPDTVVPAAPAVPSGPDSLSPSR